MMVFLWCGNGEIPNLALPSCLSWSLLDKNTVEIAKIKMWFVTILAPHSGKLQRARKNSTLDLHVTLECQLSCKSWSSLWVFKCFPCRSVYSWRQRLEEMDYWPMVAMYMCNSMIGKRVKLVLTNSLNLYLLVSLIFCVIFVLHVC